MATHTATILAVVTLIAGLVLASTDGGRATALTFHPDRGAQSAKGVGTPCAPAPHP